MNRKDRIKRSLERAVSEDIRKLFGDSHDAAGGDTARVEIDGVAEYAASTGRNIDVIGPVESLDQKTVKNLSAVASAIRAHDKMLVGWLARKFGDTDAARDIAQEAYLRVWRFAQGSMVDNPRALIFKTAANLAANEFRSRKRWKRNQNVPVEGDETGEQPIASDAPSPERTLCAKSDAAASLAAIEAMPEKVRRAFIMSRFEEMTYREIASVLSVSVSSVEKYIITALVSLRAAIDDASEDKTSKKVVAFPKNGLRAKQEKEQ